MTATALHGPRNVPSNCIQPAGGTLHQLLDLPPASIAGRLSHQPLAGDANGAPPVLRPVPVDPCAAHYAGFSTPVKLNRFPTLVVLDQLIVVISTAYYIPYTCRIRTSNSGY